MGIELVPPGVAEVLAAVEQAAARADLDHGPAHPAYASAWRQAALAGARRGSPGLRGTLAPQGLRRDPRVVERRQPRQHDRDQ